MSICQGLFKRVRQPGTVAMSGGGALATPDDNLAISLARMQNPDFESVVRVGPQHFRQWAAYSVQTDATLTIAKIYGDPRAPFLDWEMGLGTPFAGTYAPPIGLVAGGSA